MRLLVSGMESLAEAAAINGDVSLSTAAVRGGSYAYRINAAGSNTAWARFGRTDGSPLNVPVFYARVWVWLAVAPATGTEELFVVEGAEGYKFWVRITSQRKLIAFRANGISAIGTAGPTALSLNTWNGLEFMVGSESEVGAADGPWEIRINGASELSGWSTVGADQAAYVQLGAVVNRSASDLEVCFDDLVIDDAGWPGLADISPAVRAQYYRRRGCY